MINYDKYGQYAECIKLNNWYVDVADINASSLNSHIQSILNIFRDGIETQELQGVFITVNFGSEQVELSIMDYFINLIMWRSIVNVGESIKPHHIFFEENLTRKSIKKYIDTFVILPNRKIISNMVLNNIINDTLSTFKFVSEFAPYICNTINLEDDIQLMLENPQAWDIYHTSLEGVQLDDTKRVGTERTNTLVNLIKNSDNHCLSDFFRSGEGINLKQFKEVAVSIGTKPDGNGQVYPSIIDSSFIMGGLKDIPAIFVESSAGRTAQILSKQNVGDSGHFARLLGLNNQDTILHLNKDYVCDTVNFEEITIRDSRMLSMFVGRWYRLNPRGVDYCIYPDDTQLIGIPILLRSPMTCASKSRGEGICYKCYGELAYVNNDINIGKIAAELLSSVLTQILLSAKHLLESVINKMEWTPAFYDYFVLDANILSVQEDINLKGYTIMIDGESITHESEVDDFEYNEYITEFELVSPNGEVDVISTSDGTEMYISTDLNELIRAKAVPVDGKISIKLDRVSDIPLFLIKINNNELTKTLNKLKAIIDKNSETKQFDKNTILQTFIETVIEGNLDISAIHCEVILSNQIRDSNDILLEPDWSGYDPDYTILTLKKSLSSNPSVVVSLSFQELSRMLYNPLTYRKSKTSFMDLFMMLSPQLYMDRSFEGEM